MIIDQDLRNLVKPELRAGEKLLWVGKPRRFPIHFLGFAYIAFSIIWSIVVFTVVLQVTSDLGAASTTIGSIFSFLGVFFFLLGVLLVIIPTKETYALTNQRGLILWRFPLRKVANLSPEALLNLDRTGGTDVGTLNAEQGRPTTPMQLAFKKSFKNISNSKQVEDLIFKTFQKGSS